MNRDSAIRAARITVTGAQNAGRLDSYYGVVKMGIEMEKQWLATLDARTRHGHSMADGQTVAEDKPFIVGGYKLMYPGNPSGPRHEIYNRRCTLIAKAKGVDMSDALRRDSSGPVSYMTCAQWEASKRGAAGTQISTYQKDNWIKNVAKSTVDRYNNTIQSIVNVDAAGVFGTAKNGVDIKAYTITP